MGRQRWDMRRREERTHPQNMASVIVSSLRVRGTNTRFDLSLAGLANFVR